MFDLGEMLEGVISGGGDKAKLGLGLIGEAREGLVAGCWGLVMSGFLFFAFYFILFAWIFQVEGLPDQINAFGALIGMLLCPAALLSPLAGFYVGIRPGNYSMVQHFGCFFTLLGIVAASVIGLAIAF